MTREEKEKLIRHLKYNREIGADYLITDKDADEIIKALEQKPCEDAISRQAAKKALEDRFMELQKRHSEDRYETNFCLNTILELPSVNPQPKTGHWIEVAKYSDGRHEIECSKCGSHIFDRGHANSYVVKEKYRYCPRCGAKMAESEEV